MHYHFETIVPDDLEEITAVMTRAFDDDSQRHLGLPAGGPPGYNDGSFFQKWLFGQKVTQGVKMLVEGRIIGAAILWIWPNNENYVGTIFIDPPFQNKGLGKAFWRHIESAYPQTVFWQLETPAFATSNHHFYEQSCGFTLIGKHREECEEFESYVYRKIM